MSVKSGDAEGAKLVVYEGRWKLEPSSEADVKFAAATDFTCPVCQDLVWQPLVCEEGCGKLFCRSCTTQWASDKARYTCPACRHKSQPVAISRAVKLLLGKIRVKCPEFQHLGCDWAGGYFDAETHLQQRCQFASIPCPHCLRSVCRRDHAKHADTCPQKPISCGDCKQGPFAPADLTTHRSNQCPAMPTTCDDCKWAGPRGALVDHVKLCPEVKIMCEIPLCGTNVKRKDMGQHMNQSAIRHVELLLAENLKLRNQLMMPSNQPIPKRQKTGRKRRLAFSMGDFPTQTFYQSLLSRNRRFPHSPHLCRRSSSLFFSPLPRPKTIVRHWLVPSGRSVPSGLSHLCRPSATKRCCRA